MTLPSENRSRCASRPPRHHDHGFQRRRHRARRGRERRGLALVCDQHVDPAERRLIKPDRRRKVEQDPAPPFLGARGEKRDLGRGDFHLHQHDSIGTEDAIRHHAGARPSIGTGSDGDQVLAEFETVIAAQPVGKSTTPNSER